MSNQRTLITTHSVRDTLGSHQLRVRWLRSGRNLRPWRGVE